ncbi:MAG TPA: 3-deoxy-8-phosphooctulonate synthase [Syntrophobacteraceae bacterium]|nr:3-deoxy-8-phosphooctulonate synthase [Syntrophobacteraceae bacterium]
MESFEVLGQPIGTERFFVIAGPCVLESERLALVVADTMRQVCGDLGIPYLFKSSFDKANRTSWKSFRGPGLRDGLGILSKVRSSLEVPVITDIHEPAQAEAVAAVVDVLQIPAFLARQTDLLAAAGNTGKPINVKKAQFLSPWDMGQVVEKIRITGNNKILLTERGTQFGYNNLVVDMRAFGIMAQYGCPVVFDATHSVQLPGGRGDCSGGDRRYVPALACAAVAAGAHGVFLEVHEDPDQALCDGPNSMPLDQVPRLLERLLAIYAVAAGERVLQPQPDGQGPVQ